MPDRRMVKKDKVRYDAPARGTGACGRYERVTQARGRVLVVSESLWGLLCDLQREQAPFHWRDWPFSTRG